MALKRAEILGRLAQHHHGGYQGRVAQVETSSAHVESAWFQLFKLKYEATDV
jgi:hypothetical protein